MFTLDQSYLKQLIESSPDIIIAVDRDGTVIYYNDGAVFLLLNSTPPAPHQQPPGHNPLQPPAHPLM